MAKNELREFIKGVLRDKAVQKIQLRPIGNNTLVNLSNGKPCSDFYLYVGIPFEEVVFIVESIRKEFS